MGVCALGMALKHLLVLDNRLIRTAFAQKGTSEIVLRFFLVRYGSKAHLVSSNSTLEIVFGYKRIRQVTRGFGVCRPNVERFPILRNGVIDTPNLKKCNTEVVLCCPTHRNNPDASLVC